MVVKDALSGGVVFTPDEDAVEVDVPEDGQKRTMEEILEEIRSISTLVKRRSGGQNGAEEGQDGQTKEATKDASLKTSPAEAIKQTGDAQVKELRGINDKIGAISAQLGALPADIAKNQKTEGAKAAKEEAAAAKKEAGKEVEEKKAAAGEVKEAKGGGEIAKGAAAKPAPEAKKADAGETEEQKSRWDAFTAQNRQKQGLLQNEWTKKVDSRVERLKSQSKSIGQTLHAVGMHSLGDRFLSLGESGGILDAIGARLFLPALLAYGGLKLAGDSVKAIRETRNRDIDQGINAGEATEETAQNGVYDLLHNFGFSAVSGTDLTNFRQSDLSQNWGLFTAQGNNWFEAQKTLKTMGWNSAADQQWAQEMVAMGQSAQSVKAQFMDLSKEAKETGLSFKNLTSVVGTAATDSDKALGKTSAAKIIEGSKTALNALKSAGLEGNESTIQNLESNGIFQIAERQVLEASGHAQEAMNAENNPEILLDEVLKNNLFSQALKDWEQIEYETSGGNEERYAANLENQGIKLANVQTSLTTSFGQGSQMSGVNAAAPATSSASSASSLHVTISSTPELSAKVARDDNYAQAIHGKWEDYYNMNNYGSQSSSEN